jgi:hypothetical protein
MISKIGALARILLPQFVKKDQGYDLGKVEALSPAA